MVLPHAPLPPTDPHLLARRLPQRADLLFLAPGGKGRGSYTQNEERISPLYESRFSAELPPSQTPENGGAIALGADDDHLARIL